jgi:hypothetical protein
MCPAIESETGLQYRAKMGCRDGRDFRIFLLNSEVAELEAISSPGLNHSKYVAVADDL